MYSRHLPGLLGAGTGEHFPVDGDLLLIGQPDSHLFPAGAALEVSGFGHGSLQFFLARVAGVPSEAPPLPPRVWEAPASDYPPRFRGTRDASPLSQLSRPGPEVVSALRHAF